MRTKFLAATAAVASGLMLAACGGGDDAPATPTLSGTAAVGTPIVGGTVKVSCAGGSPLNTTTSSSGGWTVSTSGQTLPCAVQVSGGTIGGSANTTPYHSLALNFGTVNITPLTDLVVANLSGQAPGTWFNGLSAGQWAAVNSTAVNTALDKVKSTLGLSTTLNGANPLTTDFQAVNGNLMDDVLEAFKAALATAGIDHAALLALAAQGTFSAPSGFDFAAAYQSLSNAGGGGSGSGGGGTTGGGDTSQPGLTLSRSIGGLSQLANSAGTTTTITNTATQVTTHKTQWGDALNSMLVITQHSLVTSAGLNYEGLTINLAKVAVPLSLSAQLANASGGLCILSWNIGTMPSSFKLCSQLGVNYNRSTGAVTLNNTGFIDMVGGNGTFTVNGGLGFAPY